MSGPDACSFPVSRRRKSELPLRPRPATSCYGMGYDTPQSSQQRLVTRISYHAISDQADSDRELVCKIPTTVTRPYPYHETFSELSLPASISTPPQHVRRHSNLTQSVIDGLSAVSRRLSISKKNGKKIQKDGTTEPMRESPFYSAKRRFSVFDLSETASSSTRPKSRGLLSSISPKKRPSMPIMTWLQEPIAPAPEMIQKPKTPKTPNMSRLSLSDILLGGESARAAAAAQNEALANARATPLPPYYPNPSESDLGDSESGIGINVSDTFTHETVPARVAKCDPCAYLPTELMEFVFSHLDADSLLQAELVSKQWQNLSHSQVVWRKVFYSQYANNHPGRVVAGPSVPGLGRNVHGQDYRKLFKVRKLIDNRWENGEAAAIYLNGHKDSVYCVQFDEKKIITGSRDNTIRVWDAKTYQCVRKLGPPSNPTDRDRLPHTTTEPQGIVPFFLMEATPRDPRHVEPAMWHQASILCLQYDSEILVTGSSDHSCLVWSIKDDYKPMFRLIGHRAGVLDVCIDSKHIITCSKDTTIKIWERATGRCIKTLRGHQGPVNAVQVRGNLLASASGDGMSKLWRIEDGLCIKEFHSRERGLACVEFSEDGKMIYAGGNDRVIYEYNTLTGNIERELTGHTELVRSLHLDTANHRLISGSYDHSVKVWNTAHSANLPGSGVSITLEGWTSSWMLAAKSDYRKIVCAGQDGRVVIVDFGYGIDGVNLVEA